MRTEIAAYYRRMGERTRLATGNGRLEFLRTWDVLTRVLPPPPATVLDVGGATGAYAGLLAAAGHRVHVVDPVPEHAEAAAALPGVTAALGDARALGVTDASSDVVLLLGPLYHLLDRDERIRVWRETARAVRPGGVVVAATISRFASTFDGFAKGYRDAPAGLTLERVVSVEGPVWMMGERVDALLADPDRTALLLESLRAIEDEPSLLGASSHLLTVARRPAAAV